MTFSTKPAKKASNQDSSANKKRRPSRLILFSYYNFDNRALHTAKRVR
jgi:hypothetical protein